MTKELTLRSRIFAVCPSSDREDQPGKSSGPVHVSPSSCDETHSYGAPKINTSTKDANPFLLEPMATELLKIYTP